MTDSDLPAPADAVDTVVVLSVDSLRRDRVHASRDGVPLTPTLDDLASDSIEFEEGISPGPGTADSMPAILTGGYPSQFPGFSLPPAGTEPLTLAEHLADRGFSSAAFNQNNLIARRYNFDRGFDFYYDISEETREEVGRGTWRLRVRSLIEDTPLISVARTAQTFLMENFGKSLYVLDEQGDSLTDRAIDWLAETDGKRFLWMHYMDTHHPYLSSEDVMAEFDRHLPEEEILKLSRKARSDGGLLTDEEVEKLKYAYDCSVRFVDQQIGRILGHLREEGSLDDAFVVVTADHGEEFLEHGQFGHRDALYDEHIRVPLLVRYPHAGTASVDGQAPVRDMIASIVDGDGWFDHTDEGYDYVLAETQAGREGIRCARGGGYKLIADGDDRTVTRVGNADETVVEESGVPDDVLSAMEDRLAETHEVYEIGENFDEEAIKEDLAALGYLDE